MFIPRSWGKGHLPPPEWQAPLSNGRPTVIASRLLSFIVILAVCIAVLPAQAQDKDGAAATIAYRTSISGVEGELRELLEKLSVLKSTEGAPPRSYGALRSRLEQDIESFRRALRSEGYYDSRISEQLDSTRSPVDITLRIFAGPRYRVDRLAIDFTDNAPAPDIVEEIHDRLPLAEGDPVRAADILAAEDLILALLPQLGHPLAEKGERRVVIDHERDSAEVVYRIAAGPEVVFGAVHYSGDSGVDRDYLRRLLPWREDDRFDQRLVDRYRRTLIASRLFSGARIGFAEPADALRRRQGRVRPDIEIALTQANLRTISLGAGFSTSEGFGGEASWEHRNFFGSAERLTLTLRGAELEQSLSAEFRKPNFRRLDQTLTVGAGLVRQDTDAFDSLELNASLGLERTIGRYWLFSAATEAVFTEVEDLEGERTFLLAALPLGVNFDSRDDILNPSRGVYIRYAVTPHLVEQDSLFTFVKNELQASSYRALDEDADFILAGRLMFGSIVGAENSRLPASRRFFSGGGGSIRGFGFQDVGPRDASNDPLGGRSIFEFSFETRVRLSETIGIVPFLEAGQVWEKKLPQFDSLRWGAGLGLRYFTSFAPIRLDVAFPINKRRGDDDVQFYISLGQSF